MKRVLITGASKGIGLALSTALLDKGYEVVGSSRSGTIDRFQQEYLSVFSLDLSNWKSIEQAIKQLQTSGKRFDIIINNAGIGPDLETTYPDKLSFEQTFEVNVKGTVFFTEGIISLLNKNGLLVNVSSKMGSIDYCSLSDSVAYRMSKAALNMYTKILVNRYKDEYTVAAVHPGWVQTDISANNINARLEPKESARRILQFLEDQIEHGIFWDAERQEPIPW